MRPALRILAQTSAPALVVLGILLFARGGDSASLQGADGSFRTTTDSPAKPTLASISRPHRASQTAPIILDTLTVRAEPHLLDGLSALQIQAFLSHQPERLGPASLGRANRGGLLNGTQLQTSRGLRVIDPARSFGTPVTISSLEAAATEVLRQFPNSPRLDVGDISRPRGGYLRPHRSHQSGRDVDLGYYYRGYAPWYTKATSERLDRERTWAFLKALIAEGSVEYVFMDRSVQGLLREHAEQLGESAELLGEVFEDRVRKNTLVRHAHGHLTHFHVRFSDPVAEKAGERIAYRPKRARRPSP